MSASQSSGVDRLRLSAATHPSTLRVSFIAALLLCAACATTATDKKGSTSSTSGGDTPEVPYKPTPRPSDTAVEQSTPANKPANAETPAQGGGQKMADQEEPPPPPKHQYDSETQAAFRRGVDAADKGDLTTAESEFKSAYSRDGQAAYAVTNLGMIAERRGDMSGAEKFYRKANDIDPGQDAAWDALARLYCRQKKCSQIEAELRIQISQNPAALGLRTALVFTLMQQTKYETAANEAKKVLKADERNVRGMQLLAQVYFKEGKNELAKMVLENARAVDVNDAGTHNALGLVYLALKQKQQAIESFKTAASLRPDFAEAKNNFGAMLNDTQDYDGAVRELEAAVAAAPEMVSAHVNLGNAYRGKQDIPKALTEYQRVVQLKPDLTDTYYNLAVLHLDSEVPGVDTSTRYKTSIDYFNQYRSRGGKDERVDQYIKDANKGIDKEERRKEREKKDVLRKAQKEIDDKKHAEEDAKRKVEEEAKAKADAEKAAAEKAKKDADDEAKHQAAKEAELKKQAAMGEKQKAIEDAKAKKQADLDAKKAAADEAKAKKQADLDAKKAAADEAKAKKQADLDAKKAAADEAKAKKQADLDAKKNAGNKPAAKLTDDEAPAPAPKKSSGKLGDDDK